MALSGSLSTNKYKTKNSGKIGLKLTWSATQSVVNNTSTISWTLKGDGDLSGYVKAGPITATIGGSKVVNITDRFNLYKSFSRSGTVTIPHNVDGTKTVSMSIKAALYSTSVNCTATKSFALNTISRGALLSSVEDFNDEGNPTIVYTNPSGTDIVNGLKVRITWNNEEGYTDWVTLNDAGGTYTFNLSDADRTAMLNACPTENSLAVKFDLYSLLNGSEFHNYKDAVMTVSNANPTFTTAPSYLDVNSAVVAITGDSSVIVQGKSCLRIYVGTATPNKGATSISYWMRFNGAYYLGSSYFEINEPSVAGTLDAEITAIDSRGNTTVYTLPITISELSEPSAVYSWTRVNNFEPTTILYVDGKISDVAGNELSITAKYRKIEEPRGNWTDVPNVPDAQNVTISNLASEDEWEMVITVSDSFSSTPYNVKIGKGIPLMFFDTDKNSIGINCFPDDDDQVKVNGSIKVNGALFPHTFATTEHVVGYWHDGRVIYEKTVELSSSVSINSGAWYDFDEVDSNDPHIQIIDILAHASSSSGYNVWRCVAGQYVISTRKVGIYNARGSSMTVNSITYQYVKITT